MQKLNPRVLMFAIFFAMFCALAAFPFAGSSIAQPIDTLITSVQELVRFEEAAALDIDPAGRLYVVDKGTHSVHQLTSTGDLINQFGGPGDGEGQFDSPADIDVTNGLVLVLADAGNGRIQRFSRDFLFLESLAVEDASTENRDAFGSEPAYRQREQGLSGFGAGRPVGVITSSDNEMYAIDELSNVVVKWDNNRNIVQYIGAYDQGAGSLIEPVSLALDAQGALFVADRAHEAIMVYDAFGGFDRKIAEGLCANVQAVLVHRDQLYIVLEEKVLQYQTRGLLENTYGFELKNDLVDVAFFNNNMYLLTTKSLGLVAL
ncbi:MAG: NHL repeat-containing protein [Rhodothermales bacterium]